MMTNFKERLKPYGLNKVLSYMDSDYEHNIPKALDWLERFDKEGQYAGAYKTVREVMANPDNNWNQYLKSVFSDLDEGSRRMLLENFIINASIIGKSSLKTAVNLFSVKCSFILLVSSGYLYQ